MNKWFHNVFPQTPFISKIAPSPGSSTACRSSLWVYCVCVQGESLQCDMWFVLCAWHEWLWSLQRCRFESLSKTRWSFVLNSVLKQYLKITFEHWKKISFLYSLSFGAVKQCESSQLFHWCKSCSGEFRCSTNPYCFKIIILKSCCLISLFETNACLILFFSYGNFRGSRVLYQCVVGTRCVWLSSSYGESVRTGPQLQSDLRYSAHCDWKTNWEFANTWTLISWGKEEVSYLALLFC